MLSSQTGSSLEFPVMLHATGKSPVMGIIEALTTAECRMRSLVAFEVGGRLEFELIVHGGAHAKLAGIVSEVRDALPRHHYKLRLAELPVSEREALTLVIAELHSRASGGHAVHSSSGPLARASVRAPVDFVVRFAVEGGGQGTGHAANISVGGMLMYSEATLAVGATLELTFNLEFGGARRDVVTSARIVAHQKRPDGRWQYHIAFFNVDPGMREHVAAYVADVPKA